MIKKNKNNIYKKSKSWQKNFFVRSIKSFSLFLFVSIIILGQLVSPQVASATTFNFSQNSWVDGLTSNVASHVSNQSNWTEFLEKNGVDTSSTVSLTLGSTSSTQTSTADFSGGTNSQTAVNNNSVKLGTTNVATPMVVSSASSTYSLKSDGTVWAWGLNTSNQLGDNTTTQRATPVQVLTGASGCAVYLCNIISIAAGANSGYALKSDGTVWAWGHNGYGQLGDGTTTQRATPVQVSTITDVTAISAVAVSNSGYALKSDGTVWAWGNNDYGQLGDNTIVNKSTPVQVSTITDVTAISAGSSHALALKLDGTVWSWGLNGNDQLGDNTVTQRNTPVQVHGTDNIGFLTGITSVSGGNLSSYALKDDGTVWAWGLNTSNQLGDNTTTQRATPVQVSTITGINTIAAGGSSGYALKSDGTVWSWGLNGNGQLGDDTIVNKSTPVQVLSAVVGSYNSRTADNVALAGNSNVSFSLKSDGTVWAWGQNGSGWLGDNTTTERHTPVQVHGPGDVGFLTDIISIAGEGSGNNLLALKSDGTVWAWGYNGNGQLGDNTITERRIPVQVHGTGDVGFLTDVIAIASGDTFSYALKSDGTVWSWGLNNYGQLGDNTTTQSKTPIQVHGTGDVGFLTNIISISSSYATTYALKSDGTVWAWGWNAVSQLGDNTTTNSKTPVQVHGTGNVGFLTDVRAISSSSTSAFALKNDGTVWGWGTNSNRELGDNTTTIRRTPVQVHGTGNVGFLTNIIAISSSGGSNTYALKSDGTVWSWGWGLQSKIGDNTTTSYATPVQVHGTGNVGFLTDVVAIGSNTYNGRAIQNDGTVWAWGLGQSGQLGDNTIIRKSTPVQALFTEVTDFNVGSVNNVSVYNSSGSSFVLKSDGTVWSFGLNDYGQLGDNTTTNRSTPVQVHGPDDVGFLTNVAFISGGSNFTYAIKSDGTVWAWGYNAYGQLGDNTTTDRHTPVQVHGLADSGFLTGVTAVYGGNLSSYALKDDGTVWSWGYNGLGQLGDNTTTDRHTPVQVHGLADSGFLTGVIAISGGNYSNYALKNDGTVWAWGNNGNGQLGDNTTTERDTPIQVHGLADSGFLTDVTAISSMATSSSSYALKSDGTVWSWGNNGNGQLGDNTTTERDTPVQVHGTGDSGFLTGVASLSVGDLSSYALKSDGTVWSWGKNIYGNLGDNTTTERHTPVQVHGLDDSGFLTGVSAIFSGGKSSHAIKSDGTVWSWGNNLSGELGDSTITERHTPVMLVEYSISDFNAGTNLYNSSGDFTSAVVDLSSPASLTTLSYVTTLGGQTLTVDARAGDVLTPDGTWTSWLTGIASGGSIASLGSHQYVQYKINLSTSDTSVTPTLDSISINYSQYSTGDLTSSIYDSGNSTNSIGKISWTAIDTSETETVEFQVRSSADNIIWSAWCGYADCSGSTYFSSADNGVSFASDHPLRNDANDRYLQYKVFLSSAGTVTPVLSSVQLSYVINIAPIFNADYPSLAAGGVTASQNSDPLSANFGKVEISYSAKDTDTATGDTNPNQVLPSFEYSLDGGDSWDPIPSIDLSVGDDSLKTILAGSYTEYNATWSVSSTIPDVSVENAKVRVSLDDNDVANSITTAATAVFPIDTELPVGSITFDAGIAGDIGSATITIPMPTDQSAVQYLISDDAVTHSSPTNTGWVSITEGTTIPWTFDSDIEVKSLKYQFKDIYGNISVEQTISTQTPVPSSSFLVQDTSNVTADPAYYDMYIGWQAADATGFSSYKLEYATSTDNITYGSYSTLVDPSFLTNTTNYFIDRNLDSTKFYRFRLGVVGTNGNTSVRSNSYITTKPDGVQNYGEGGGGSVATASKIENVVVNQNEDKTVTVTYKLTDASISKKVNPSYEAYIFYNMGITLPSGSYSGGNLTVSDASKLKTSGYVQINNEVIKYTGKTDNTLTGLTRSTWPIDFSSGRNTRTNSSFFEGTPVWIMADSTAPISITDTTISSGQDGSIDWNANNETSLLGSLYSDVGVRVVVHDNQDALSGPLSTQNDYSENGILAILDLSTPTISFSTTTGTGDETVTPAVLTLNLSHSYPLDTTVNYTVTGTATGVDDYTLVNGTATIVAGQTTTDIEIPIIPDGVSEFDETIIVTLSSPVNSTLGTNTVFTYTIIDSLLPTISFDSATSEGLENIGTVNIPVSLSSVFSNDVTVDYTITGTATGDSVDYLLTSGTVTILAGQTTSNISLVIDDDSVSEDTETVIVTLSNPVSATLGVNSEYTFSILDDEIAITEINANNIKSTSAIISWTTADFANSTVDYGVTGPDPDGLIIYTLSKINTDKVLTHNVYLGGLTPATLYYVKTTSLNIANESTESTLEFTTTTGPVISVVNSSSAITDTSAVVTWTTDIAAGSYVKYSTDITLVDAATPVGTADLVTEHSVSLTGLNSAVTYYFKVYGADVDANIGEDANGGSYYSFVTLADMTPPEIFEVDAPILTSTQVAIVWTTNEPADGKIYYSTTTPVDTSNPDTCATTTIPTCTSLISTLTTKHIVAISGLTASTKYYYVIASADSVGNPAIREELNFTTTARDVVVVSRGVIGVAQNLYDLLLAENEANKAKIKAIDTEIPVVSNVKISNVTAFSANIAFETNEDTIAFVDYGQDTNYGKSEGDSSWKKIHIIKLASLNLGTDYYFKIKVMDKANNIGYSEEQSFKTKFFSENLSEIQKIENIAQFQAEIEASIESILPSLVPPYIEKPEVSDITDSSATITFRTNIKSYPVVSYATDASYNKTKLNPYNGEMSDTTEKDVSHILTLTSLKPNTTYHVMAKAFSLPQVVGKSEDFTFSTLASKIQGSILDVKKDSFTVAWSSDVLASSIVEYKNITTGKIARLIDDAKNTAHSMKIENLSPGTTYEVTISGVSDKGNIVEGGAPINVRTSTDDVPPFITNIKVDSALIVGRTDRVQTIISWTTDEPSNSVVYFEEGSGSPDKELVNKQEDLELTKNHAVILTTFKPGTVYRFTVASTDDANNTSKPPVRTIITPKKVESIVDVILKNFDETFNFVKNVR